MKATALAEVVAALNAVLQPELFASDSSHNGLQVENSGRITKVCCGVDASMEFFERAHASGANLCIVHHGISWGSSLSRIEGLNYRLVSYLLQRDMALYASHLPLDAHPELGNNAQLAKALGLRNLKPFGIYNGLTIGFQGFYAQPLPVEQFADKLAEVTGSAGHLIRLPFGKSEIGSVGVISGGAASEMPQAIAAGLDAFVSGECGLQAYNEAKHAGINAFFAGHYSTETFGVKALGHHLEQHFALPVEFIDFALPY